MLHLIAFLTVVILFTILTCQKPKNYPPGPTWLPVIGSALSVTSARQQTGMLCKAITKIAGRFKNNGCIGLKIGKDLVVMAITGESIKEMMTNEEMDGRPMGPFYETRTWDLRRGVLLTDEAFWQEQRRFIVRHLKEFGFARRGMTEIIEKEASHILQEFNEIVDQHNGQALVSMHGIFSVYVLNTLWLMMAGIRYTRENHDLKYLQNLLHELFTSIDMMGALFSHFPFLRYIAPTMSGYKQFVDIHECMHGFIGKELENHKKSFNNNDEPRDLMDVYLQVLQSPDKRESFTEQQLLAVCLDMFVAGSETTTKTMGFAFLYLIREPEIQRKMQQEIDTMIGRERMPTLDDRSVLPYCDAVVLESLRMFMSNTFGIPHRALKNTKLSGYDIPKDTMLIAMFRGMMLDEKHWPEPTKFRPERFLDTNGKAFVPENFYPFGVGKHRCMGEMMGRANLFMFITTLFQRFDFLVPAGHDLPSDVPIDGATPSVRQYTALVVRRH